MEVLSHPWSYSHLFMLVTHIIEHGNNKTTSLKYGQFNHAETKHSMPLWAYFNPDKLSWCLFPCALLHGELWSSQLTSYGVLEYMVRNKLQTLARHILYSHMSHYHWSGSNNKSPDLANTSSSIKYVPTVTMIWRPTNASPACLIVFPPCLENEEYRE